MSGFGQCCGIDDAIKIVGEYVPDFRADLIKNRLEYHRDQAEGVKPKYYKADSALHSYYKCGHCGHRVEIINNFCPNCGYMIKWDSTRCLTGLPLVDAAEREKNGRTEEVAE